MSEVTFQQLKKWTKVFGIKSFGMRRDDMYAALVKEMKKKKDDLTEPQLEWLAEQSGEKVCKKVCATPAKKTLKKKVEETEEQPKKKLLRKKAEEAEPEEKPKKTLKKKEAEPEEEGIKVKLDKKQLKEFAEELGLKFKPKTDEDYHEIAQNIYETVDGLEDSDREALSKPLFKFYVNIKRQTAEAPAEETPPEATAIELPSTIKLKQWGHLLDVKVKGKTNEEIAEAILAVYVNLDDSDKEELPTSLREWADSATDAVEAPAKDEVVLPDIKTLKAYAKAVGLSIKDTMKAKGDPEAIATMIVEAYDPDQEDEYPEEVKEFYAAITDSGTTEPEPEPEATEEETFTAWLVEAGYDEKEVAELPKDEMVDLIKSTYEEEDSRNDLPSEAVEFLKETYPDMFKPAKKKLLKKK